MLDETRNAVCLAGSDQFADRPKLIVRQGNRNLGSRHGNPGFGRACLSPKKNTTPYTN